MPSRTLAIMFTDIQGFTDRTSMASRRDVTELVEQHERLLLPAFDAFAGTVVKTIGDAFPVTFDGPTDAVLCGIAIQEILREYNDAVDESHRIRVRVAINIGDVEQSGNDVYGEPVNIAARLETIAEAGQVYFTEAVYQTMNRREVPSSEIGERVFKGIPHPIRVYKVIDDLDAGMAQQLAVRARRGSAARAPRRVEARRRPPWRALAAGAAVTLAIVSLALLATSAGPRASALAAAADAIARGRHEAALDALAGVLDHSPADPEAGSLAIAAAEGYIERARIEGRTGEAAAWLDRQLTRRPALEPLVSQRAVLEAEHAVERILAEPAAYATQYLPEPLREVLDRSPGRADVIRAAATKLADAVRSDRWPTTMPLLILYERLLRADPDAAGDEMFEIACIALSRGRADDLRYERATALLLAHFEDRTIAWAHTAVVGGAPLAIENAYRLLTQVGDPLGSDAVVTARYQLVRSPMFYSNGRRDEMSAARETLATLADPAQRRDVLALYDAQIERGGPSGRVEQLRADAAVLRDRWGIEAQPAATP